MKIFVFFLCSFVECVKELLLVQAIYRNGESTPAGTYKTDYFQKDKWVDGFAHLTLNGQRQQTTLGRLIREKYTDFFPSIPDNRQLVVRSIDSATTITSAMANNMGIYSTNPADSSWPDPILIPVHTVPNNLDHLLISDLPCPFFDKIWTLAKTIPKVRKVVVDPELYSNLSHFTGESVTDNNLRNLYSILRLEKSQFGDDFEERTPWCTVDLMDQMSVMAKGIQHFSSGIGLDEVYVNEIDIGRTLKQLRGGTLLADLYNRMVLKVMCRGNGSTSECGTINGLRYQAYSTYESTLFDLFSTLNMDLGYPEGAACLIVELWQDSDGDRQTYFRLIYYQNDDHGLENVITKKLPECFDEFCDLSIFRNYSLYYQPDMEKAKWCTSSSKPSKPSLIYVILAYLYYCL